MKKKAIIYCQIACMLFLLVAPLGSFSSLLAQGKKIKVMFLDGRNKYHKHWPEVNEALLKMLNGNALFDVTHVRTPAKEESLEGFKPAFSQFDVVVFSYDDDELWPEGTRKAFEKYMKKGGGMVSFHMADNAFPTWPAYNQMIGLGGWGNRNEKDGPYVYFTEEKEKVVDNSPGPGGHHGKRHQFVIEHLNTEHPITKGLPQKWLHHTDELYDMMRGPAENMEVLGVAYSSEEHGGTGRWEPLLMTIDYGKGRVFHTTLGHDLTAISCKGFIATFFRGIEWAATGKVTQPVPSDFPTAEQVSLEEGME